MTIIPVKEKLLRVFYEYCPWQTIILGWCAVLQIFLVEMTLPVMFGYLLDAHHMTGTENIFLQASIILFDVYDKLGIALFLWCAIATGMKLMYRR